MSVFKIAGMLLMGLFLAPTASAEELTPFERKLTVVKNGTVIVGEFYNILPNCQPRGTIVLRMIEEPKLGKTRLKTEAGFPNLAADARAAACNTKSITLMRLYYDAGAELGQDQFSLDLFYVAGTSRRLNYTLNIK
jgi:hypothetical protein